MAGPSFIPNRDGSDIQSTFQLKSNEPLTPNKHKRKMSAADNDVQKGEERRTACAVNEPTDVALVAEEASQTFATLLSSEIFGASSNAFAAAVAGNGGHRGLSSSPSGASSGRPSLVGGTNGSQPTTPTKRNIYQYSSRSPSSSSHSRSRSAGVLTPGKVGLFGSYASENSHETLDSPNHSIYNLSPVKLETQRVLQSPRKAHRTLSRVPYKVLDAPDLADDFYLNLVDWSSSDVMGVGLGQSVYLWSAQTSEVTTLCDLSKSRDKVTGISWSPRGHHLAVGTNAGLVQIWDTEHLKLIRTMRGHANRVGALAWNEHILTTASRDRSILHRDVRIPSQSICELKGHRQEVCGLKWNAETNQLASGGNDNKLFVWDGLNTVPLYRFGHHKAAVKAIAWSPHQRGLLASGGGTADMHIRFFNTITGQLLSEVDTGSQVCNLAWSKINNELISTHGFSGGKVSNQVQVWKYPEMSQVATLMGHAKRVLYLAMNPEGDSFVSGAGDETLRFWDIGNSPRPLPQRLLTSTHRLR